MPERDEDDLMFFSVVGVKHKLFHPFYVIFNLFFFYNHLALPSGLKKNPEGVK
jgi:hypothetical protein